MHDIQLQLTKQKMLSMHDLCSCFVIFPTHWTCIYILLKPCVDLSQGHIDQSNICNPLSLNYMHIVIHTSCTTNIARQTCWIALLALWMSTRTAESVGSSYNKLISQAVSNLDFRACLNI